MREYFSVISKGVRINLSVHLVSTLGLTFAFLYFQEQGLEFYKLFSIWWIAPLSSLPFLYFMHYWPMKRQLITGMLMYPVMLLTLIFYTDYSFILYGIANGIALALFWVSLNAVFFKGSVKSRDATDYSIYFIIGPLLGIVLPPLGALIIDSTSYVSLFILSLLLSVLPLYVLLRYSFDIQPKLTFTEASRTIEGVRLIHGLNAALNFFFSQFIPIYLLYFVSTEYEVGGAASGIAFLGLVGSIIVARLSDKEEKRSRFSVPMLLIMSVLILSLAFVESLFMLGVLITTVTVVNSMSSPIRFALVIDDLDRHIGVWRAKEFYGNTARTIAFAITAVAIFFDLLWLALAVFSAICILLAILMKRREEAMINQQA